MDSLSEGCFVHAHASYLLYRIGDDALGEKSKKSEDIGKECAEKITSLLKMDGVDKYAADQLLIYLALAGKGKILASEITDHVRTNIEVIQQFLPVKFTIAHTLISCETHA